MIVIWDTVMKFDDDSTKALDQQTPDPNTIRSGGTGDPTEKKTYTEVPSYESFSQNNIDSNTGVNFQPHNAPESHYAVHAYEYENLHSNTASATAAPDSHYNMLVSSYDDNRDFGVASEDLKMKTQPPQFQNRPEVKEHDPSSVSLQSLPGIQFPPLLLSRPELEPDSGVYKTSDKKEDFPVPDNNLQVNPMDKTEVNHIYWYDCITLNRLYP